MYILIGVLIGFMSTIPLGPVNIFVISQAIKRNFIHGLMAGFTAAILDVLYCLVAIVGLSHITFNISQIIPLMKIGASLVLFIIGLRLIKQSNILAEEYRIPKKIKAISPRPVIGVILLYVSNPSLYTFWLAVGGLVTSHYWVSHKGLIPIFFAVSCGIGALTWYFLITRYVTKSHSKFKPQSFRRIFLGMAVVLFAFSAYTLLTIFFKIF